MDSALERRCRLLARAYPDGGRADEVLATLLECSAGRRGPRLADAVDVLWHGALARLGDPRAAPRFGRWGDAASVAVVTGLVAQAATALVALAEILLRGGPRRYPRAPWLGGPARYEFHDGELYMVPLPVGRGVLAAFALAAALAVALAVAACLGRAGPARALAAVAAVGGLGAYLADRSGEYTSLTGRVVLACCAALVLAAFGTRAVARAARVAPRWWWAVAAGGALVAAEAAMAIGSQFGRTRPGMVLTQVVAAVAVALVLALPLGRSRPAVPAGAVLLALPVVPAVTLAAQENVTSSPEVLVVVATTVVGWLLLGAVAALLIQARS